MLEQIVGRSRRLSGWLFDRVTWWVGFDCLRLRAPSLFSIHRHRTHLGRDESISLENRHGDGPKTIDRMTPRNIMMVWITSVQITAFIPPYRHHFEWSVSIPNHRLQYWCRMYIWYHRNRPLTRYVNQWLDSKLNLDRRESLPDKISKGIRLDGAN